MSHPIPDDEYSLAQPSPLRYVPTVASDGTNIEQQPQYYHDAHCNAPYRQPMGEGGCSCYMYQRALKAEAELREAKQAAEDYKRGLAAHAEEANKLEAECATLRATVERLSAPVTDDEVCNLASDFHDGYGEDGMNNFLASRKAAHKGAV